MTREYWDEFTHLVSLAVAITLFVIAFKYFGKLLVAKAGIGGLAEALAA